ncbi:Cullin family-domain-containing protein [Butyriboletus roseoflavus]|nr:Cullin family-domain-containing protein [Butyriboletus roseoflavus]
MVLYKSGSMLYKGVCQLVTENVERLAEEEIIPAFPSRSDSEPMQQGQEAELLLRALRRVWDDHTGNMSKLRDLLKYMVPLFLVSNVCVTHAYQDRVYTKSNDVPEIWDAGLDLFLKYIVRPPIQDHVVSAVLTLIQIERDGYVISRSAVKECVDVLLQLAVDQDGKTVYKRDLEPAILSASEVFYKSEAQRLVSTCDAPEYLRRAEGRFVSETSRTHHYLYSQTGPPLLRTLEQYLLTQNLSTVISMPNSGLDSMIDLDKVEDLNRLYRLFTMVPTGLLTLRRSLKDSILRRGRDINQSSITTDIAEDVDVDIDEADAPVTVSKGKGKGRPRAQGPPQTLALALKWVQDVLDLKDRFERLWKQAFASNREVESALNEVFTRDVFTPYANITVQAFEDLVNLNGKAPEFISLFIDENLKKGLKGKTDIEVDLILEKTITVFRYLTEKDAFERYYKNHLAKRLLFGRSVSDDAERGMLAKLKVECGYQFTQKLEGMFHDMKLSSEIMQGYRQHLQNISPPELEISVTVMTSTFWPMSHTASTCVLPEILTRSCKSFEHYYLSRHSGRRLTWQPSLGNADVRVQFKARKHDLNVSTFALIILLLFEDVEDDGFLTYGEIKSTTLIPEHELQRHLQSLACAKYKILKKHPPGRDINPEDSFSFNSGFSCPMQRIKIGTVSAKVESTEERKETRDRIDEERQYQTEACIVRVMKDRKQMAHNDLINEVTRQLAMRFQPNPQGIKKRVETLIDREYLERCDDRKSYKYLVRRWSCSLVYDTAYPSVPCQGMNDPRPPTLLFPLASLVLMEVIMLRRQSLGKQIVHRDILRDLMAWGN